MSNPRADWTSPDGTLVASVRGDGPGQHLLVLNELRPGSEVVETCHMVELTDAALASLMDLLRAYGAMR